MKIPKLGRRDLFPRLRWQAYLAHAGVSPLSLPVEQAVAQYTSLLAQEGAGAVPEILAQRQRLRERLAELLAVPPDLVALTSGTTFGLTAIAQCFDWRPNDTLILVRGEFPTNVTPWQRAAQRFDLGITWLEADHFSTPRGLEELEKALLQGARLLATSAVQFQSGLAMPVAHMVDLCHRHGCRVCVDGIQAAGVMPVPQAMTADYWVGGAHKWLMGLEGVGYLYASTSARHDLSPWLAGWLSHVDPVTFLFEAGQLRYDREFPPAPAFLEMGTWSGVGGAALLASLDLLLQLGVDNIFDHVARYLDALEPTLLPLGFASLRGGPQQRSGILSLRPPRGHQAHALTTALAQHGVCCSSPDGLLRFAPHWSNSLDEVEFVRQAVTQAVHSG